MSQVIKITKDLSALAFKDFVSVKTFPFIGATFPETLALVIRYARKKNVNVVDTLNQLAGSNFHSQLVSRVYGDVRRNFQRLDKVLIPSILFSFIEQSLAAVNLSFTSEQTTIVKMLHLSLFKQWGAVVDSSIPATVVKYDKLTPSHGELVEDMIRVFVTSRAVDYIPKDLPRDKISASIVGQYLLDTYTEVHTAIVNVNNIADQFTILLTAIKEFITDTLVHEHLARTPAFLALTNNITLVRMAQAFDSKAKVGKYDGWYVDQSLAMFNEYLRSADADIVVYGVQSLAATVNVYRFVNDNSKEMRGLYITPNYASVKWIQWFHRNLSYGDHFTKMLPYRDPSGLVTSTTNAISPSFLEGQLVNTLSDIAQYLPLRDSGLFYFNMIPDNVAADLLMYVALARSEHVRVHADKLEYFYKIDQSIVAINAISKDRFDSMQVARTSSSVIVLTYSGKVETGSLPYPIRVQTIEKAAENAMIDTASIANHGQPLNIKINMNDMYYTDGQLGGGGAEISISDFIFNGDPISLVNISYSDAYKEAYADYVNNLTIAMTIGTSISHLKSRLFQNFWMAIKKNAGSQEFEWAASGYRRALQIAIDPNRPQDASRNYVKSMVALTRFMLTVGTGVPITDLTTLFNSIFEGQIDILGMLSDSDIIKVTL